MASIKNLGLQETVFLWPQVVTKAYRDVQLAVSLKKRLWTPGERQRLALSVTLEPDLKLLGGDDVGVVAAAEVL